MKYIFKLLEIFAIFTTLLFISTALILWHLQINPVYYKGCKFKKQTRLKDLWKDPRNIFY